MRQGRIHISLTGADKRVIKKYIALSQPVARDLIEDRKRHEQQADIQQENFELNNIHLYCEGMVSKGTAKGSS